MYKLKKYNIEKSLLENPNLIIYQCISKEKQDNNNYIIHRIKDKILIKYYLKNLTSVKNALPFVEHFVIESDLFLVFKDYKNGVFFNDKKLADYDRKTLILKLLANLSLNSSLPNFIKYMLIDSNNIISDSNNNIHFRCIFDLLNPNQFDDFKSIQLRIADFIETNFDDLSDDINLSLFTENCKNSVYFDEHSLFVDYKKINSIQYENKEPWIYEKLFTLYSFIKRNSKQIILLSILVLFIFLGLNYIFKPKVIVKQPYKKSQIGQIIYSDPYSEELPTTEILTINSPPSEKEKEESLKPELSHDYTIYIVEKGDYLNKISSKIYGNNKYALTISTFNDLDNPNILPINYPLKIPTIEYIDFLYNLINTETTDH